MIEITPWPSPHNHAPPRRTLGPTRGHRVRITRVPPPLIARRRGHAGWWRDGCSNGQVGHSVPPNDSRHVGGTGNAGQRVRHTPMVPTSISLTLRTPSYAGRPSTLLDVGRDHLRWATSSVPNPRRPTIEAWMVPSGLSRMTRNCHVRFLGGKGAARLPTYPTLKHTPMQGAHKNPAILYRVRVSKFLCFRRDFQTGAHPRARCTASAQRRRRRERSSASIAGSNTSAD